MKPRAPMKIDVQLTEPERQVVVRMLEAMRTHGACWSTFLLELDQGERIVAAELITSLLAKLRKTPTQIDA